MVCFNHNNNLRVPMNCVVEGILMGMVPVKGKEGGLSSLLCIMSTQHFSFQGLVEPLNIFGGKFDFL